MVYGIWMMEGCRQELKRISNEIVSRKLKDNKAVFILETSSCWLAFVANDCHK